MQRRIESWPHSMVATSTHDSKRSEDVRARINVLSEIPSMWSEHVARWREINKQHKHMSEVESPTPNDEYLFYQTLIGVWPLDSHNLPDGFSPRITEYTLKAMREAKEITSWANPNQEYEKAAAEFVKAALENKSFLDDFIPFERKISYFGMLNSLSQILIKLTAPGIPDIYQGNELWEFNLVDPDNRRPVDYSNRQRLLEEIPRCAEFSNEQLLSYAQELSQSMQDGRIKMYVTWKALSIRNEMSAVFRDGDYTALKVHGADSDHVLAFTRTIGDTRFVVIVPRLCARLVGGNIRLPLGQEVWHDTAVHLPKWGNNVFHNVFTGEDVRPAGSDSGSELKIASALNAFPVALLKME
jgi:(1->4)-alpha-D-glucan 1-alpha-D-glucosylmutase